MTSHQTARAVQTLRKAPLAFRLRQGVVVAVNITGATGQTIDVQIGGSTVTTPAVPYMLPVTPVVGQGVWLFTDGRDAFAFGSFGPAAMIPFAGSYGAGFADAGGGFHAAGYYKDSDGRTCGTGLVGATATATAPKTVFTLPVGYRPTSTQRFTVYGTTNPCVVDVLSTGVIQLATSLSSGNSLSMNGISFLAEA